MKLVRVFMFTVATLSAILFAAAATAQSPQRTLTGVLSATGERSPAWQVDLEEPIVLGGKSFDVMEVYSADEDLTPLAGKRVSATGSFVQWRTPERGKFIVLELCDIVPADE